MKCWSFTHRQNWYYVSDEFESMKHFLRKIESLIKSCIIWLIQPCMYFRAFCLCFSIFIDQSFLTAKEKREKEYLDHGKPKVIVIKDLGAWKHNFTNIYTYVFLSEECTELQNDWFLSSEFYQLDLNGNEIFEIITISLCSKELNFLQ